MIYWDSNEIKELNRLNWFLIKTFNIVSGLLF